VAEDNVEIVESFAYLGVDIHNSGSSEQDFRERIAIVWLPQIVNWRFSISLEALHNALYKFSTYLLTKLRLYRVSTFQALSTEQKYGPPTRQFARNLDVFDQWRLRRLLRISWRARISNQA